MPELNIVECIIQGGSVGVAVLLILAGWRLGDKFTTLMTNHFVHFGELLADVKAQTEGINARLDRLCDLLQGSRATVVRKLDNDSGQSQSR